MIEIETDDIELLKEACETLAYKIAMYEHPNAYYISDEKVADILRGEFLAVKEVFCE